MQYQYNYYDGNEENQYYVDNEETDNEEIGDDAAAVANDDGVGNDDNAENAEIDNANYEEDAGDGDANDAEDAEAGDEYDMNDDVIDDANNGAGGQQGQQQQNSGGKYDYEDDGFTNDRNDPWYSQLDIRDQFKVTRPEDTMMLWLVGVSAVLCLALLCCAGFVFGCSDPCGKRRAGEKEEPLVYVDGDDPQSLRGVLG
jgi:hypothetical protein